MAENAPPDTLVTPVTIPLYAGAILGQITVEDYEYTGTSLINLGTHFRMNFSFLNPGYTDYVYTSVYNAAYDRGLNTSFFLYVTVPGYIQFVSLPVNVIRRRGPQFTAPDLKYVVNASQGSGDIIGSFSLPVDVPAKALSRVVVVGGNASGFVSVRHSGNQITLTLAGSLVRTRSNQFFELILEAEDDATGKSGTPADRTAYHNAVTNGTVEITVLPGQSDSVIILKTLNLSDMLSIVGSSMTCRVKKL